jgi:hypothetical protein
MLTTSRSANRISGLPIGSGGIWVMLPNMPDHPPPNGTLPPHVMQPKLGTNEQQRRDAARKLAERHNAALRPPPDDATSQA